MLRKALLPTLVLSATMTLSAKRTPPPVVEPVTIDGLTFEAPQDDGAHAYIQARDAKTKALLWSATLFRTPQKPGLESDVQAVFIKKMHAAGHLLVISDERGRQYTLNPSNRAVRRIPSP